MTVRLQADESFTSKGGFCSSLELVFTLSSRPTHFRTYRYTWERSNRIHIASPLCPKILRFADGTYLMANTCLGSWVYDPSNPRELRWVLLGREVQPFFIFTQDGTRSWLESGGKIPAGKVFRLLKTGQPVEPSFSRIPFSPVVVFTDHCDFDSDRLLVRQRELFDKHGIRVTKGVFLKKHSHKGEWNSAYEGNESEYSRWVSDGHELCYHALSQSRLPNPELQDRLYRDFSAPVPGDDQFRTWIDHGYQRYNLSKSKGMEELMERLSHLSVKGVRNVWNYYDVAEAVDSLNMLDYRQMSPLRILASGGRTLSDRLRILIFFNSGESGLLRYRSLAGRLKQGGRVRFIRNAFEMARLLIESFRGHGSDIRLRNAQSLFPSTREGVTAFQSIIVKDFVKAFGKPYRRLKEEFGLAIVHTYFSFLEGHHGSTLFLNPEGEVSIEVERVLESLGRDIKEGRVWNPTLDEFAEYHRILLRFDFERPDHSIHFRHVYFQEDRL
jgi:hypothetical protein